MYKRQIVNFRLSVGATDQIDRTVEEYADKSTGSVSRSDVVRACIKVAFNHWTEVLKVLDEQSEAM